MSDEALLRFLARHELIVSKNAYHKIWLEQRQYGPVDLKKMMSSSSLSQLKDVEVLFQEWEDNLSNRLYTSDILAVNFFFPVGLSSLLEHSTYSKVDKEKLYHLHRFPQDDYLEIAQKFKTLLELFPPLFSYDEPLEVLSGQTFLYQQHLCVVPIVMLQLVDFEIGKIMGNFNYRPLRISYKEYTRRNIDNERLNQLCNEFVQRWYKRRQDTSIAEEFSKILKSVLEI